MCGRKKPQVPVPAPRTVYWYYQPVVWCGRHKVFWIRIKTEEFCFPGKCTRLLLLQLHLILLVIVITIAITNIILWGCPTKQRCLILLGDFKMKMGYILLQLLSPHSHKKSWYQIHTDILNWKQKCIASSPSLSIMTHLFSLLCCLPHYSPYISIPESYCLLKSREEKGR